MHAVPMAARRGHQILPGTGVKDSHSPLHGSWVSNLGLLEKQLMLLTNEISPDTPLPIEFLILTLEGYSLLLECLVLSSRGR